MNLLNITSKEETLLREHEKWIELFTNSLRNDEIFYDSSFEVTCTKHDWEKHETMLYYDELKKQYGSQLAIYTNPMPHHAQQGKIGDCWFIAALMAIACKPERLKKIIPESSCSLKHGIFSVKLYVEGEPRMVVVDGHFPLFNDSSFHCAHVFEREMWTSLIEKAAAKVLDGYDRLYRGRPETAFRLLTGSPIQRFKASCCESDFLWDKILEFQSMNFPMTINTPSVIDRFNYFRDMGLRSAHAYAILDTRVHNGVKLVLIGNDIEWNGKYSDLPTFESSDTDKFNHPNIKRLKKRRLTWIGVYDLSNWFNVMTVCKYREGWFEMRTQKFSGNPSCYAGGLRIRVERQCQITVERTECGTSEDKYIGFINIHKTNQNNDIGPMIKSFKTEMTSKKRTVDIDPIELEPGYYMIVYISAHREPSSDYYWIFRSSTSLDHFSAVPVNYDYLTVRDLSLLEMMKGKVGKEIEKGVFLQEYSDWNVLVVMAENKTKKNIAIRIVARPIDGRSSRRFFRREPIPKIAYSETINMTNTLSHEKGLFHVPANSMKILGLIFQDTCIKLEYQPPLKCLFNIKIFKGKEIEEWEKQHPVIDKKT